MMSRYAEEAPPPPYQQHRDDGVLATAARSPEAGTGRPGSPPEPGDRFVTTGPSVEAHATWASGGRIEVALIGKGNIPDLPARFGPKIKEYAVDPDGNVPVMNIVVFAIGEEDDVKGLITLATQLVRSNSHRVRVATQEAYHPLVTQAKASLAGTRSEDGVALEDRLEMYEIAAGLDEGLEKWRKHPKTLEFTMQSLYRATHWPEPTSETPFAADLIISNPGSLAHVHLAELYGIPLHIVSTKPASATTCFPHPESYEVGIANSPNLRNYLSYPLVESLVWQGVGKHLNKNFRQHTLDLPPLDGDHGVGTLDRLRVPTSYCWDQVILPKPEDWKENIDVTGALVPSEASYIPSQELVTYLSEDPAPIYIRLDLTNLDTEMKEQAVGALLGGLKKMAARAILDLRGVDINVEMPKDIYLLSSNDDAAQWLLEQDRVSAVVHDGGVYMSSLAVRRGIPSVPIIKSGKTKFWADRLYQQGAAVRPIPIDQLTTETISLAWDEAAVPELKVVLKGLKDAVRDEDGPQHTVDSVHRHLPLLNMRCDIVPSRVAFWYSPQHRLRLSGVVAGVLAEEGKINLNDLSLNRPIEWPVTAADSNPIVGGSQALLTALVRSPENLVQLINREDHTRTLDLADQQPRYLTDPVPGAISGPQPITDFQSGMRQAGRDIQGGVKDGLKGFVNTPLNRLKQGNVVGAVFGTVGGTIGLVTNPIAGAVRAVVSSGEGVVSEMQARGGGPPVSTRVNSTGDVLRRPRQEQSLAEAKLVSPDDRKRILEAYKVAKRADQIQTRKERQEDILSGRNVANKPQQGIQLKVDNLGESLSQVRLESRGSGFGKSFKGKGKA